MSAPRQPHQRAQRKDQPLRLRLLRAIKWWNRPDPNNIGPAWVMVSIGAIFIVSYIFAAISNNNISAALLLLFGGGLLLFGSPVLFFALIEWSIKRFVRARKYCGCCTFYKPGDEEYQVGVCRADTRQGAVQRTHLCPYFRYSERAMVRDRLWQQRYIVDRIRSVQGDSEQAGSDD
jgi:hypothetical protein